MGLDFLGSDASWSYGGFNRFRERLAKEIGIDLQSMVGFGGSYPWDGLTDPLIPLLNHSDCDGHLTPDECSKIWERLLEIVDRWPEGDYDKHQAYKLAVGMRECALTKVNLKFC